MNIRMGRPLAAIVLFVAISIFAWTLMRAMWYAPPEVPPADIPANTAPITAATSSLPLRLLIPTLGIDASVQYVGINARGEMGIPNNFKDVAWYKLGVVPGQLGSAVMDGHMDNGLSLPGVFKRLDEISLGDDVYVRTKDGSRLRFKVTEIETYGYHEAPSDYIFSRDDKARLVLITCDGAWVKSDRTYDKRLVVFAELQST